MPVLSLVGFALGAVGFVGTVKSLAERLVEDIDNFQNDHKDISALLNRSQHIFDRLKIWKDFWLIDDETSDELLIEYWGENMISLVRQSLETIEEKARDIEKEIKKRYGISRKTLENDQNGTQEYSPQETLKKKPSRGRRVINVLFQHSTFSKHFKSLEEAMSELDRVTKSQFLVRRGQKDEAGWEKAVKDTALRHFLDEVRSSAGPEFDCLQRRLSVLRNHSCELRLSHNSLPLDRLNVFKAFANKKSIEYHLLVSKTGVNDASQVHNLYCRKCEEQESVLQAEDVESLFSGIETILLTNTHLFVASHYKFRLLNSSSGCAPSKAMRAYIRETSCNYNRRLQGAFTKRKRTQAAYEIAECAFLFLTKELVSNICTCGIGRTQSRSSVDEFTFRFGEVLHHRLEPSCLTERRNASPDQQSEPWCSDQRRMISPMRRFGLLLVEICLGKVVYDADEDQIDLDSDLVEAARGLDNDAIVNMVRQEAGDDISGAVEYCLMHQAPLDHIDDEFLEEFFDEVILP
ncbi:MAG: hypothetical protein Q9227_008289 [Pyrenula ochraceoflavens]